LPRFDGRFVFASPACGLSSRDHPRFGHYRIGLMKNRGSLTIPMDYNYRVSNGSEARMNADHRKSIASAYARSRQPWNIGHHFATHCAEVAFPMFRDRSGGGPPACDEGAH
jgi:hypothetical protein